MLFRSAVAARHVERALVRASLWQAFLQLPEVHSTRLDQPHLTSWELAGAAVDALPKGAGPVSQPLLGLCTDALMYARDASFVHGQLVEIEHRESAGDGEMEASVDSASVSSDGLPSDPLAASDSLAATERSGAPLVSQAAVTISRLTLSVSRGELVSDCLCVDSRQFPRRLMRLVLCPRRVRVEHRSRSWVPWAVASPPSSRVCWAR